MNCRKMESKLADLLFDPSSVDPGTRAHVEACSACQAELSELKATMAAMDAWAAPEPSPFFDGKLRARLRAEQQAAPAGWLERMRARLLYGSNLHLRPVAAGALAVVLAAGGGSAFWLEHNDAARVQESATVRDLQSLDGNAQVFQQLSALDNDADDSGAGTAN